MGNKPLATEYKNAKILHYLYYTIIMKSYIIHTISSNLLLFSFVNCESEKSIVW